MADCNEYPLLGDRFEAALGLAHRLHRYQIRKGTTIPYISHLMAVCGLVLEDGGAEDEVIAALLHDAVEDQGGLKTLVLIQDKFGCNVAEIVQGLSDSDQVPKPPWKVRKEAYLLKLQQISESTLRVAIADKLHNTRMQRIDSERVCPMFRDRFNASKNDILWFLKAFIDVCHGRGIQSQNLTLLEQIYPQLAMPTQDNIPEKH